MATTTLLFWNLLHNRPTLERCVSEIDSELPVLGLRQPAYPITNLEASLPYLRNCVKENFRLTPVFTMPLARRVLAAEGLVIAGDHFPRGVS
jgi:cytochrome P450